MKKAFMALVLLLAAIVPALACCQEFTLQDCLERALAANSGLKSHAMELSAAEEGRFMARTAFFPTLKVRGNYTVFDEADRFIVKRDVFGENIPRQDAELTTGDTREYALSAILTQPIFTGGNLTHSYRKAQAVRDEAALGYERWKKDLVRQVKTAFYETVNSQFHADSMRRIAHAKRERLRVLTERMVEGYVLKEDLMRLEGDILLAELEMTRSESRAVRGLRKLKNLMEYGDEGEPTLKGVPQKGRMIAGLAEVKGEAARYREELVMARKRSDAAQEEVLLARSALLPQVSLVGQYTRQKETENTRPDIWALTAQLDWTLFEWGRTRADIAQKSALRQRADFLATEQAKQVLLEVEDAWRGVREAEQLTTAREHLLKTAEYVLQQSTERYAEGTTMLADVVDRETEFLAASNNYSAAINEFASALAILESTTGSPLEKWVLLEDLYRPDFESYSKRLQELLQNRQIEKQSTLSDGSAEELPDNPMKLVTSPAKNIDMPIPASGESESPAQEPETTIQVMLSAEKHWSVIDSKPVRSSPVDVQLASFKNRKQAVLYRNGLHKKSGLWPVKIVSTGGAFKVRLTGFPDRAAAAEMVRAAGIKEYLIVRRGSGH